MANRTLSQEEVNKIFALDDTIQKAAAEKRDYADKKFLVDKKRTESIYQEIKEKEKQKEAFEQIQLGVYSDEYFQRLEQENDEYLELAKKAPVFLHKGFAGKVPFFAKNLILVGAKSGQGKSTLVANIAFHTIVQGKKVLIITNEERVNDVYNRITCLIKGWKYTDHANFTEEQKKTFREYYRLLAPGVHVIADDHNQVGGTTTTKEGVRNLLEKARTSPHEYGAVLIDYFQNIKSSTEYQFIDEWKLLDKVGDDFEEYRLKLNFPIILFAQLKMNADGDDFKYRIERAKSIYNRCTCAIEIIAHYEEGMSEFKIHKSRFNEAIGQSVWCKFERGKYNYYDLTEDEEAKHKERMEKFGSKR